MSITHVELCARAVRWLERTKGCGVVFSETHAASCMEIPDAIGWKYGSHSFMVECKISRSDFLADRSKVFRLRPEMGMGRERYYLVPKELITVEELPEKWGLLYLDGKVIRVVKKATPIEAIDRDSEVALLVSGIRRMTCAIGKPIHAVIRESNEAYRLSNPRPTAAQRRKAEVDERIRRENNLAWLLSIGETA